MREKEERERAFLSLGLFWLMCFILFYFILFKKMEGFDFEVNLSKSYDRVVVWSINERERPRSERECVCVLDIGLCSC